MRERIWRAGKITAGVLLMIVGVVGLFLPFLQGIVFLVMGLMVLSTVSPRARAWLDWVQERTRWRRGRPASSPGDTGDGD